ncbi:RmlC-like cupin domain-containing protein [Auriculariales sp. MPI-PUGE-AT-0066]|nr:RmlC-like cupin domain-containing protein [Auriculariales sp. MPI-PUGE-AT-0066]
MSEPLNPTPLKQLRILRHHIPSHDLVPNSSISKRPLLVYRRAFDPSSPAFSADSVEAYLRKTNVVEPQWRYTMYPTSHFHTTTHEVLVVTAGSANLCFGGEDNPARVELIISKGDVVIIPAGVAHRLLKEESNKTAFQMVGSYPHGCTWDMCYGRSGEEQKVGSIAGVPWFASDPIYGNGGPATSD